MHFCRFNTGPRKAFEKQVSFSPPFPPTTRLSSPLSFSSENSYNLWRVRETFSTWSNFLVIAWVGKRSQNAFRVERSFHKDVANTSSECYNLFPHSSQTLSNILSMIATLQNIKILTDTFQAFPLCSPACRLDWYKFPVSHFCFPPLVVNRNFSRKQKTHLLPSSPGTAWFAT